LLIIDLHLGPPWAQDQFTCFAQIDGIRALGEYTRDTDFGEKLRAGYEKWEAQHAEMCQGTTSQAAEKLLKWSEICEKRPAGVKTPLFLLALSARVNSCPFKTGDALEFFRSLFSRTAKRPS
jgi:hypothetical protein